MDIRSILACLIALSGCTNLGAMDAPGQDALDASGQEAAIAAGPGMSWANGTFLWREAVDGAVAARLVADGAAYDCTVALTYTPSATAPGWDSMVVVEGADIASWVFMGSVWSDVHAHAGPIRSDDVVEPHTDTRSYPIEWQLEGLQGEVQVFIAAVRLDSLATTTVGMQCDGAEVVQAAVGRDAALFGGGSGEEGVGADANALFAGATASAAAGGGMATDASDVWLVATGYPETFAHVEAAGPDGAHAITFVPDAPAFVDSLFSGESGRVAARHVGGPGTYAYRVTEAAAWGTNGGLLALEPLGA